MSSRRYTPKVHPLKLRSKVPVSGLDLRPHQIILAPLVTEKGMHQSTRYNAYCFQVHLHATKAQIKAAVEDLFRVRVEAVRTQNRQGKSKRTRFVEGRSNHWKKAIVTLHEEDRIDFV